MVGGWGEDRVIEGGRGRERKGEKKQEEESLQLERKPAIKKVGNYPII
jgi:hypothetical protein